MDEDLLSPDSIRLVLDLGSPPSPSSAEHHSRRWVISTLFAGWWRRCLCRASREG